MGIESGELSFLGLAFLAGAVHMLAPDHWLPLSLVTWQRNWRTPGVVLTGTLAFLLHVAAGAGIYFLARGLLLRVSSDSLFLFAAVLLTGMMTVRLLGYRYLPTLFISGPQGTRPVFAAVLFLGPCESLIPILMRSAQLGLPSFTTISVFALGTLMAGMVGIFLGRLICDRPEWLPASLAWTRESPAWAPALGGILIGLALISR